VVILDRKVERGVLPVVLERMAEEPVIALEGARSVGKSTLLRSIAERHAVEVLDLDDPATRSAVAADPAFHAQGPSPVCIDEYQRVPEILDAIKAELNRDTRPGRFVLTGSTRWNALPRGTQSLTGRLDIVTIRPLCQAELDESSGLVLGLIDGSATLRSHNASTTTRADYIERVVAGGFPLALSRTARGRSRWLANHVRNSLERDVAEISRIRQAARLPELFARLASQTGQLLNMARIAGEVGLEERTTHDYIHLLERLFLIHRLPAWGRTLKARTSAAPKIHLVDSGVAAQVLGLSAERLASVNPTAQTEFGHLLETFAYGEVAAQAAWLDDVRALGHWRTRDGHEVDLIIERSDGGVIGIEVKASGRITDRDFAGLRKLRGLVGDDFVTGVVLHTGQHTYAADEKLHGIPLDRLWEGQVARESILTPPFSFDAGEQMPVDACEQSY